MLLPQGFDLKAIQVFVVVAEAGGMTLAAQRLGLTQSAVSQTVAALEKALGEILFDRGVRPLAMTTAGNLLYGRGRELLAHAADTLALVREGNRKVLSSLTIAMAESFANTVGPALVREQRDRVAHWRVWSGISPDHHEALMSRLVDVVVTASDELDSVDGLERHLLFREPFVLVFPAAYDGPVEPLDHVGGLPFIRYSLRSAIGRQIERQINRMRLKLPIDAEFDTATGQLTAVRDGMGWSMTTPLCLLQDFHLLDRLRVLPMTRGRFFRRFTLVARERDLGDLPAILAASSREILRRRALQPLFERFPWMEPLIAWPDR